MRSIVLILITDSNNSISTKAVMLQMFITSAVTGLQQIIGPGTILDCIYCRYLGEVTRNNVTINSVSRFSFRINSKGYEIIF